MHLFLTEGALQLLVVDLHKFHGDPPSRGETVYIWLDALLCRVPGCAVLIVATHADGFNGDREQVAAALNDLEAKICEHIKAKREEWESAVKIIQRTAQSRDQSVEAPPSLYLCGCVEASGLFNKDLHRLCEKICSLAGEGGKDAAGQRLFPSVGQTVPVSWARAWAVMDALHEGADPCEAARSLGERRDSIEGHEEHRFITWEVALEEWSSVVHELSLLEEFTGETEDEKWKNVERVLEDALRMRERGGTLMMACRLVHLDPSWINLSLRELLDHRLAEAERAEWWKTALDEYCREFGLRVDELVEAHRSFLMTGRLSKDYLAFLWRSVPGLGDEKVRDRMIGTMSISGAMFRCDTNQGETEEFMVPARLPSTVADAALAELERVISDGVQVRYTFQLLRTKYVPPGIIAQFLGWFCRGRNIVFRACWNRGAAFLKEGVYHLVCLRNLTDTLQTTIEISVAGKDERTVWGDGLHAEEELRNFLHDRYPGLSFMPGAGNPELKRRGDAQRIRARDVACLRWPVPRLACLLPSLDGTLTEDDRNYLSWSARLQSECLKGKGKGKGVFRQKFRLFRPARLQSGRPEGKGKGKGVFYQKSRLFFVCAQDYSLAECGPGGQGYEVKELLEWVKKAKPLLKVGGILANIALTTFTGLPVPVADINNFFGDELGGVVSELAKETLSTALENLSGDGGAQQQRDAIGEQQVHLLPLDGFVYEQLTDAVRAFELDGIQTLRKKKKNEDAVFCSFAKTMEFVDRGGDGVEWAWVRKTNVKKFVGSI